MFHSSFGIFIGRPAAARILSWVAFVMVAAWCQCGHAQWISQTNVLKPGWNAVFLHVDASYATVNQLMSSNLPIGEIWYWQPALPTGQFIDSPQLPTGGGSQWSTWTRSLGTTSVLQRLTANGAYLVREIGRAHV